jgi:nucleotide-binding universal stress UspA family protein
VSFNGPILCPVDFSPLSQRSLRLAIEMCRRTGARLILEHNLNSPPPSYLGVGWMWSEEHATQDRDASQAAVERLRQLFAEIPAEVDYEAKVTCGPVEEGVLFVARALGASLIVMGTHGPSDAAHKSLTERLVLQAPCSVLTTGESYDPQSVFAGASGESVDRLSILVPVDFSKRSLVCACFAMDLARVMPHRIHLLHIVSSGQPGDHAARHREPSTTLEERLRELVPGHLTARVSVEVRAGDPAPAILDAARARRALFILMPAHRQSPLQRLWFGTTTLGVLHGSDCPVWFLPPRARKHLSV